MRHGRRSAHPPSRFHAAYSLPWVCRSPLLPAKTRSSWRLPWNSKLQCKPMALRAVLEDYFDFKPLNASWRTEILAGFTTFMTMAYIVFVNPAILHEAGMPLAAVTAATCISAAVGGFLMGGFANYP